MTDWDFYGRSEALEELNRIVSGGRWFFCRVEGRRRIGKTFLLSQLSKSDPELSNRLIYMQVPDSDERDVATAFQRSLMDSDHHVVKKLAPSVIDFPTMARAIGELCQAGMIVVLDEFQYFTRSALYSFNSFLQAEVDVLRVANLKRGGLFILGSLQADMNALLDDRGAPLYGRITQRIKLQHWDFEELLQLFHAQKVDRPSQWLTLWSFFEGVPKFYHDAYEQGLFDDGPENFGDMLLTKMFVRSSSPLSEEADTWFLRELRGRALSVLTFLADHAGCSNGELLTGVGTPEEKTQISAYLYKLVNAYGMVDKLNPVFADSKSRNARYYISDNFLQAWLAVAKPAREAFRLKPLAKVLELSKPRIEGLEGFAFEKLIRKLHEECSHKGKGDFELSSLQMGYWNRSKDVKRSIEIDLVALDEGNKRIRFGSCKRAASAHDNNSLAGFQKHVDGFLAAKEHKHLEGWSNELVVFSPVFSNGDRKHFDAKGFGSKDLRDYAALF
jgi:AAA+ ATPase superfamily predicted ATPase